MNKFIYVFIVEYGFNWLSLYFAPNDSTLAGIHLNLKTVLLRAGKSFFLFSLRYTITKGQGMITALVHI